MHTDVNGVRLFYRIDGSGDLPWLVLGNSLMTTHRLWDRQMATLTRRYRVLRHDTRGHGDSASPPPPYRMDDLVADLAGIMDKAGIGRATVMGLSLGGMTAMGMTLAHPERVERLVVCDARADTPPDGRAVWDERIAAVRKNGTAPLIEPTLARWFRPHVLAAGGERLDTLRALMATTTAAGFEGCAEAIKFLDYLPRLGRIEAPTRFVVGEHDQGAPVAVMKTMHEAVPGSTFAIVPEAGHIANVENPDGFMAAIAAFLRV